MGKVCVLCGMFASAFLLISDPAIAAGSQPCYTTYYQTKNADCLDTLAETVRNLKPNSANPTDHSNLQAIVGFFAVIFANSPRERGDLLHKEGNEFARSLYVESLYRAGLPDDAKIYADANGLSDLYGRYQNQNLASVKTLNPDSTASDNDLLIGAYSASGDAEYIKRILGNFTSSDDSSVSDAIRVGDTQIPDALARHRAEKEAMLRARFEQARKSGDLSKKSNPAALARYLTAIANGICVQAAAGATAKELREVAAIALAGWPGAESGNHRKTSKAKELA